MASEAEFSEASSLIERLINSRNRDLAMFLPFILALTNSPAAANTSQDSSSPNEGTEESRTQTTRELRDRIIFINPLTQGMVVIEGSSSSSLDFLFRDLLNKDGHPPASKASIEAMPLVEIGTDGEECVICLEEWEASGMAKQMPCKHRFHGECIEKWLNIHGSCPICRHKMPVENNDDESRKAAQNRGRRRELWVSFSFANNSSNLSSNPSPVVHQNTES